MNNYLFFDTETTGLHADKSDRMLSLAYILTDEKGKELKRSNKYIKPAGFTINENSMAFEVNGISNEIANEKGEDLKLVLNDFVKIRKQFNPILVAHNFPFDFSFLMSELVYANLPGSVRQLFFSSKSFCTAEGTRNILKLEGKRNYRRPRLPDLYSYCFGKVMENHHDAMADTQALKDSFFELVRRGSLKLK